MYWKAVVLSTGSVFPCTLCENIIDCQKVSRECSGSFETDRFYPDSLTKSLTVQIPHDKERGFNNPQYFESRPTMSLDMGAEWSSFIFPRVFLNHNPWTSWFPYHWFWENCAKSSELGIFHLLWRMHDPDLSIFHHHGRFTTMSGFFFWHCVEAYVTLIIISLRTSRSVIIHAGPIGDSRPRADEEIYMSKMLRRHQKKTCLRGWWNWRIPSVWSLAIGNRTKTWLSYRDEKLQSKKRFASGQRESGWKSHLSIPRSNLFPFATLAGFLRTLRMLMFLSREFGGGKKKIFDWGIFYEVLFLWYRPLDMNTGSWYDTSCGILYVYIRKNLSKEINPDRTGYTECTVGDARTPWWC